MYLMFNALDGGGERCMYLRYEIVCEPVALRHVQMLKGAATSFVLFLFGLLMAIQLATEAVLSYLKYCVESKLSVHIY
jgi:hypothetical protein